MATVGWSDVALLDLRAIHDYIAADSPMAASAWVDRVLMAVDRLIEFPFSGRQVPEFSEESLREVVVGVYRIMYRASGDEVTVLAVVHGRRLVGT